MKKEARLTGSLLARKGQATPTPSSPKFAVPAINRFGNAGQTEEHEQVEKSESFLGHALETTIETVKKLSEVQGRKPETSEEKPAEKSAPASGKTFGRRKAEITTPKAKDAKGKRIAMTLRMTEDDHLKLRLYSAHTRKSCQEVLTEALDMYLSEDAEHICDRKHCSCLAE